MIPTAHEALRSPLLQRDRAHNSAQQQLLSLAAKRTAIVAGAIVLGIVLRVVHLPFVDLSLPFRYGGLYIEFSEQIAAHGFGVPKWIPFYTDGGIPFAYPPLPFYIEAALLQVFEIPKYLVVDLLPAFFSTLSVLSFYVLTRVMGLPFKVRIAALLAYATMPAAMLDQLGGSGLPEAIGTNALIWLAIASVLAYQRNTIGSHALVGVAWAVCVLASPGTAYASFPTVLIFAVTQLLRYGWRSRVRAIGLLVMAGLVAAAVSGPYWYTVIGNHGVGVFVSAFNNFEPGPVASIYRALRHFAAFEVSGAPARILWDALILASLMWAFLLRKWPLIAWFAVLYAIPQEGRWMVAVPAAILAGLGATILFAPVASRLRKRYLSHALGAKWVVPIAVVVAAYFLLNPAISVYRLVSAGDVSHADLAAMSWAKENTPPASKLVVMALPQVIEWTPQVARRTVLNAHFGAEWESGGLQRMRVLNALLQACPDLSCVGDTVRQKMGYAQVYVYVDIDRYPHLAQRVPGVRTRFLPLFDNGKVVLGRLSSEGQ